jgi:hypothetical protein
MTERAFVIMQVGKKESSERRRADEIFNFVVAPVVKQAGLEPYRADLDPSPGAITPKFIAELLSARLVIADLTGRNPNVFYELGIAHSFARPLISIADSSSSIPFDAKDERIIELGDYEASGLTYSQGERAKLALEESLAIVLADGYLAPSPLREVAAKRSVDDLAPDDPIAAEIAQIREALEEIRTILAPRSVVPSTMREDLAALRRVFERNLGYLDEDDLNMLRTKKTSPEQDEWAAEIEKKWHSWQQLKAESNESRETISPAGHSDERLL